MCPVKDYSSEMTSRVWKISKYGAIKYLSPNEDHEKQIFNLMRKGFFHEERFCESSCLSNCECSKVKHRELDDVMVDALKDGISLIAVEESTGKLVSCMINKIKINTSTSYSCFPTLDTKHPLVEAAIKLNKEISEKTFCPEILKSDCYCECLFAMTLPEFRNTNVTTEMLQLFIELMQRAKAGETVRQSYNGAPLDDAPVPNGIVSIVAIESTKKILEGSGFTLASKIDFDNPTISPALIMCKYL